MRKDRKDIGMMQTVVTQCISSAIMVSSAVSYHSTQKCDKNNIEYFMSNNKNKTVLNNELQLCSLVCLFVLGMLFYYYLFLLINVRQNVFLFLSQYRIRP